MYAEALLAYKFSKNENIQSNAKNYIDNVCAKFWKIYMKVEDIQKYLIDLYKNKIWSIYYYYY